MRFLPFLAAGLLPGLAPAQTQGIYTFFGQGCKGTGPSWCAANNPNGTFAPQGFIVIRPYKYALEVKGVKTALVQGFELLTRPFRSTKPVTVTTEIFLADATGRPKLTSLAKSSLLVGTTPNWYRTTFTPPVIIPPGRTFFLSWTETTATRIQLPRATNGTKSRHFYSTIPVTKWTGPQSNSLWAWRVICSGSSSIPSLSNIGVPAISKSFSVTLSRALPSSPALLLTGGSNTSWGPFKLPIDLTGAGAPGCNLLVSFDLTGGAVTNVNGYATFLIPIPGDRALIGGTFHNQWVVLDPKANTLGLAFSDGGTGKIGG